MYIYCYLLKINEETQVVFMFVLLILLFGDDVDDDDGVCIMLHSSNNSLFLYLFDRIENRECVHTSLLTGDGVFKLYERVDTISTPVNVTIHKFDFRKFICIVK